jgi:Predicted integral membrane protein (DUF2275)/Putative zinc-finger
MKCEEVQFHFSDYLDKTAEGPRAKGIENHLIGCPICRDEFSWLLQCRELIAGLPVVEPPLGFTTRVMANVAEAAKKTSFWKRLFLPPKIKLPVEATAVMLLGILSFYIYQKEARNNADVSTLSQNISSIQAKATEKPNVAAQPAVIAAKQTNSIQRASNKDTPAARAMVTTGSDTLRTAAVSDNPLQGTVESRRSFLIPAQGVAAGMGLAGDMGMPRQRPFRLFPAEGELPNLGEPVPDYELYVRVGSRRGRHVESSANSAQKNEKDDSSSSGSESTKLPNLQSSPVLNVLWYTVRQEQYEQFKSELAGQATIESEIPVGIKERDWSFRSDGPLYIKVTLLGPDD